MLFNLQKTTVVNSRLGFFFFGAVIGFFLWMITETSHWDDNPVLVALFMGFLCLGLAITLLWEAGKQRLWMVLLPVVMFIFLVGWAWWQVPVAESHYEGDDFRLPTVILAVLLSGYLLLPYLQIFYSTCKKQFPYAQWFRYMMRNTYVLMMAGGFLGIFWLLLLMWAALFELVDIEFFSELFEKESFIWLASSSMMALGIAFARERSQWLQTLQNNIFSLVRLLTPVLAVMGSIFVAVLPFTGLQVLWDTGHANALLLTLAGFTLLFINIAYQEGTELEQLKPWLLRTMQVLMLLLPVFSLLALYAVYLRIEQYGLMPVRFYGFLFALVLSLLAFAYVYVGVRQYPRFTHLSGINKTFSLLIISLAVLLHTPLLDPLALSTSHQYHRLVSGQADPDTFDYAALRFKLGYAGNARLQQLEGADLPFQIKVDEQLKQLAKADWYYGFRRQQENPKLQRKLLTVLPAERALPEALWQVMYEHGRYKNRVCTEQQHCVAYAINLDIDESLEYVLLIPGNGNYELLELYDTNKAGNWQFVENLRPAKGMPHNVQVSALAKAMQRGQVQPKKPPYYDDLAIGEYRFYAWERQ